MSANTTDAASDQTQQAKRQVIAITADELDALYGISPLAFQVYVLLRTWMDYRTGKTGQSRPVSLAMLRAYCETHTPRGKGVQITAPSEKEIRTAPRSSAAVRFATSYCKRAPCFFPADCCPCLSTPKSNPAR